MREAAKWSVIGYALMLLGVGFTGVVAARWELQAFFGVHLDKVDSGAGTILNQYRFLKSVEFGAGVFCILFLGPILDGGRAAAVFLVLAVGAVIARCIALAFDGTPTWPFFVFLGLEALVLIVYLLHLRRHRA